MKRIGLAIILTMTALTMLSHGQTLVRLSDSEIAAKNATHMIVFDHSDFTTSATNTAEVFTNVFAVAAKMSVEFVGMELEEAFDTGNTNYTGSVSLKVGDGADDDLYLAATELASDGTEVFLKYSTPNTYTITSTSATYSNVIYNAGATTGNITVVTGITAATTAGELGRKVYTAADYVDFSFTPNAEEALDDNTSGRVRLYFRLRDAR